MKIFVFLQPVNGIADLAQLAERKLPKLQVAGSSPVIRSQRRKLSSVGSERLPYKQEVAGSNPAVSTVKGSGAANFCGSAAFITKVLFLDESLCSYFFI